MHSPTPYEASSNQESSLQAVSQVILQQVTLYIKLVKANL